MKTYKASTGRELSRTTEILCMVFGVVMIALGIFQRSVYAAIIGLVLLAAGAMSKSVTVSEEGIVTEYRFLVHTKREVWGWDEIKDIFCEYSIPQNIPARWASTSQKRASWPEDFSFPAI